MERLASLLGLAVLIALAWAFSTNRRAVSVRTIAWGLGLQFVFALLVLKWSYGAIALDYAGNAVKKVLGFSIAGGEFVFGKLGVPGTPDTNLGFVFAFQILPTIIYVSALFAVLYHFGVMQLVIRGVAWIMKFSMRVSGAESTNVAASIFMGQTEAPLTIRPFLPKLTQSELMVVMTAGMAHVSGGIMAAYIGYGIEAKHLLAAVVMTAPGTILMAKLLVPETEQPATAGTVHMEAAEELKDANVLGAIARGTFDGFHLALNVAAMLISFLALIALLNGGFGWIHSKLEWFPASFQILLGWIFSPIAFIIGVPWKDALNVGQLLGTRMVINELVAFGDLGRLKDVLDPRSFTIATFALCGFANFGSIGIQIGGIGALAPDRKNDLARLGLRAMIAGTMANLMSATIVGMLL